MSGAFTTDSSTPTLAGNQNEHRYKALFYSSAAVMRVDIPRLKQVILYTHVACGNFGRKFK
jgi:hypothetical protein